MARAVMEGVSFGMRDLLDLLRDLGLNPTEAVVERGRGEERHVGDKCSPTSWAFHFTP
jgi:hypothetical protein